MPQNPVARRKFVGFALRWHALGLSRTLFMEHPSSQRLRIVIDGAGRFRLCFACRPSQTDMQTLDAMLDAMVGWVLGKA